MARLTRKFLQLFGRDGTNDNFGQFGSQAANAPLNTKDPEIIQQLAAFLAGWQSALNPTNKAPFIEDMNGLLYSIFYHSCYLYQEGVPEWNTSTTYYTNSVVKNPGTLDIYASLVDNNTTSLPNQVSNANWKFLGNLSNLSGQSVPTGTLLDFMGPVASMPTGYLNCDSTAVSRATYANLFSVIGTIYGNGDGNTTFNLPNLQRRVTVGAGGNGSGFIGATVGSLGGEESHLLSISEMPAHIHDGGIAGLQYFTRGYPGADGLVQTSASVSDIPKAASLFSAGGNAPHNNMQPSIVVLKIIKT